MSMTNLEAQDRVLKIWGPGAQIFRARPDSVDVDFDGAHHGLDGNGHVTCRHDQCRISEEAGRPLLLDPAAKPLRTGGRKNGAPYWSACRVLRVVVERYHGLNSVTGEITADVKPAATVIKGCGTPIFSGGFDGRGREDGVCASCRNGWSVEGNRFATLADVTQGVARG